MTAVLVEALGWGLLLIGLVISLLGIPGPLLMVAVLLLWAWLLPELYSFTELLFAGGILLLAELLEQLGGFLGLRGGKTRSSALYGSVTGGLIGAAISLVTFNPVFVLAGLLLGAVIGERRAGGTWKESFRAGGYFVLGKTGGYLGKVLLTVTGMVVLLLLRLL